MVAIVALLLLLRPSNPARGGLLMDGADNDLDANGDDDGDEEDNVDDEANEDDDDELSDSEASDSLEWL